MDFNKETHLPQSNKILEKIQRAGVEYVRSVFSDFHGTAKGKVLPARGGGGGGGGGGEGWLMR